MMMLATLAPIVFFGCMAWAVRGHFRGDAPVASGMHAASLTNAAAFVWFLWQRWTVLHGDTPVATWRDLLSLASIGAALTLFWWAVGTTRTSRLTLAFSDDAPAFLLTAGPFAIVRHPFYTSYVVFWIACTIATPTPFFMIVPVAMAALYARAATLEERKFARSPLAAVYLAYQARTGMMLPRNPFWTHETQR